MKKGIFWVKGRSSDLSLITLSVECSENGKALDNVCYSSKSNDNFNHKLEWEKLDKKITKGYTYNFYPRGRVEIRKGKATIYLNPDINRCDVLNEIYNSFELDELVKNNLVIIKNDGSNHYKYHKNEGEN